MVNQTHRANDNSRSFANITSRTWGSQRLERISTGPKQITRAIFFRMMNVFTYALLLVSSDSLARKETLLRKMKSRSDPARPTTLIHRFSMDLFLRDIDQQAAEVPNSFWQFLARGDFQTDSGIVPARTVYLWQGNGQGGPFSSWFCVCVCITFLACAV